ncbi:MAG: NHLP-related RiPP peptide [Proteobacteria bacterium]|uniref:NHLP-related RiPP peptide n=1 Tax=Rudaea sp. TaxID=2136325 RepID=UPI00322089EE|nr:NHLP-related RiPP peptide [Pseudomonadota bacterium]
MKEEILDQKIALVLLRKLAADDVFRHHYEQDPLQALSDIGVPPEQISKLRKNDALKPAPLADKSVFLDALLKLIDELLCVALCQGAIKLHLFSPDSEDKIIIDPTRR